MTVSVLGLGPMGHALADALLDAGYRTTVWNRTESKADGLRARGALWAPSPAAAIRASDVTLINVVDHDAVDSVLIAAGAAVDGRAVVGLSSDAPNRARQTAGLVTDAGGRYLDGAIMTPTDVIGTGGRPTAFRRTRASVHRTPRVVRGPRLAHLAGRGLWPRRGVRHVVARPLLDVGERLLARAVGRRRQRYSSQ